MVSIILTIEQHLGGDIALNDDIILRIADGDKVAFKELFDTLSGNVYGFALSITKNQHDAEDVLQETFLQIFSAAKSYKPQGKPAAWIFTIAKNAAHDKLRYRQRVSESLEQMPEVSVIDDTDTRLLIKTLFEVLGDDEKQIVILHAVNGIKHREIADILGIPLGTVLSKYNRAVKKLTEYAKKEQII